MQAQGQRTAILSSLPLQILIYFENWFVLGFTAFNACAFVYKGSSYYYPKYMWPVEVATVLVFAVVQWARLFLASKSNKTEMLRPMIWSRLLTPCSVTAYWYFIYAQLYVLRVDVIMNAIGIVFVALELPFQLVAAFHFSTAIYI